MKNGNFIVFISLYAVLSLFFPHLIEATTYVDTTFCMSCHSHDDFLSYHSSYECSVCHNSSGTSVITASCNECHPINDTDGSNLADHHTNVDADCLSCHIESSGKHNSHMDTCLECHSSDDLHVIVGHESCEQCHFVHGGANVTPGRCAVCHPTDDPGKCNLANDHGSSCFECHSECAGSGTTTTTTSPSEGHIDMCVGCHVVDDLHAVENHNTCTQCHEGNIVEVDKCAACHPTDGPGTCNLAGKHGNSCLECHSDCTGGETTTTTTSPFEDHINICLECHMPDDLHAIKNHSTCAQCHEGNIVRVGTCVVCHPTDGPGTCSLAIKHGSSCLKCHSNCTENTTTTTAVVTSTTTTIDDVPPVVDIDITTHPKGSFRFHLIPLPLIMFIEGTGSNFNQTTMVTFDGDALCPPLHIVLSPTSILVFSIIRPAGLGASGNNEVIVNVSSTVDSSELGAYEEVGSCSFILAALPFIFSET